MTLVKVKKRPLKSFIPSTFLDMDDILRDRLWSSDLLDVDFWNGRSREPALNIIETDNQFEIELAAPGFAKKDFEVNVEDGFLNISAEKSTTKKEEEDNYVRREFNYSSFQRSLELPKSVKDEAIKASYHDGILSFILAKKEEAKKQKPQKIKIE